MWDKSTEKDQYKETKTTERVHRWDDDRQMLSGIWIVPYLYQTECIVSEYATTGSGNLFGLNTLRC